MIVSCQRCSTKSEQTEREGVLWLLLLIHSLMCGLLIFKFLGCCKVKINTKKYCDLKMKGILGTQWSSSHSCHAH